MGWFRSTLMRMGKVADYLTTHLHSLSGPYLFVGAGLSRRYAGLGDWQGLLSHFADLTPHPFEYYRGAAADSYPQVATLIAEAFYDIWWNDSAFADSRTAWSGSVTSNASPLKYEVAKYTKAATDSLSIPVDLEPEFELLKAAVIDG